MPDDTYSPPIIGADPDPHYLVAIPQMNRFLDIAAAVASLKLATDAVNAIHDIPKDDSWVGQYYAAVKEKMAAEARLWEAYDG